MSVSDRGNAVANPSQRGARLDALTGVRIIAALVVVLSHLSAPAWLPLPIRTFMMSGYNGVTFFYILSGFVLAWKYHHLAKPTLKSLQGYLAGRVARIYPLYLAALGLGVLVALRNAQAPEPWWLLHILALQTWSGDNAVAFGLNGPGWSIGLELFLYAWFPLLIKPAVRLVNRGWGVACLITAFAVLALATTAFWINGAIHNPMEVAETSHRWLYRNPILRIPDFFIGITLALMVLRSPGPHRHAGKAQLLGALLMIGLMCWPRLLFSVWSWDLAYVLPTVLIIWGLARGPGTMVAKRLSAAPFVFAGTISYGVYLFHGPVIALVGSAQGQRWFATSLLSILISLLLAGGGLVIIERPAQRWLKAKFSPRSTSSAVR